MNETLAKLGTVTVGVGGQASVTFNNIPQNYTDLVVKASARTDYAAVNDFMALSINGNTSSISNKILYVNSGTTVGSTSYTSPANKIVGTLNGASATTSNFGNYELTFANYTSSNYKTFSLDCVTENNATGQGESWLYSGNWASNSPINTLTFSPYYGTIFVQYSEFTLYGVRSLGATYGNSIKATGGTITTDGTYVYHTFNSTGAFQPTTKLLADVLVVAGGGGSAGASNISGGGGAGGVIYFASQALTSGTSYACTVGAGSTGATNGVNSQFGAFTAGIGGGVAGTIYSGSDGGSGGGGGTGGTVATYAGGNSIQTGTGAAAYYGNAGGYGTGSGSGTGRRYNGGGGGGAGSAGVNATGTDGGNGGNGTSAFSAWHYATQTGVNVGGTYYIAGGGGGFSGGETAKGTAGTGGYGGGGAGGSGAKPSDGAINTGGGAGGGGFYSGSNYYSGNGGSGIIIIRYKA